MGLFGSKKRDEADEHSRCPTCELLACTYATGVEQLLQAAMWLDRDVRFGDAPRVTASMAKVNSLRPELQETWANLTRHRAEDHEHEQ